MNLKGGNPCFKFNYTNIIKGLVEFVNVVYNKIMARRYSKKNTRKTRIMLSPKDAGRIIETQFTDKKGNKITLRPKSKDKIIQRII